MKHKILNAFTLAEVLITLAIIGIVAVLTVPSLIQRYQEKATVTKLKKAYSLLNQAYQMAVIDHGTYDQWGMINAEYDEEGNMTNQDEFKNSYANIWKILAPYLKVVASCDFTKDKCRDMFLDSYKIYRLDGTLKATSGGDTGLLLADGILLTGGSTSSASCSANLGNSNALKNVCGDFSVKIGIKKSKYTFGKDAFYFYITKYGIYPIGMPEDIMQPFENTCNLSRTSNHNGYGCSAWVIMNGNMDYLHCDDLSWDGKKSCSDK